MSVLDKVIGFTDAVPALFNIIGLYLLAPVVKRELADFMGKIRTGEIEKLERVSR